MIRRAAKRSLVRYEPDSGAPLMVRRGAIVEFGARVARPVG